MSDPDTLSAQCTAVAEASQKAAAWVSDPANSELVGAAAKSNVKSLRRVTRRARKLAKAAKTRMSVSVFGPSQAGKSFLVSVLARPEAGELHSAYDHPDGTLNYLREVNPEGQGESTGLVTRFTMVREHTPPGFPIKLTLLSEADILRTILNSFFNDGDNSEEPPEPGDLSAHFEKFNARAGAPVPGLSHDDVLEVGEYVDRTFARTAYAAALKPFWEEAADLAPRLSRPDREAFFAIIWGNHAPLGQLYRKLADALAAIDHAEVVYVGLDALVPRETSIIDVKTLAGLSGKDVGPDLAVHTDAGRHAAMARGDLCALAAEMNFPMQLQPSEVLGRTDLLDFPGARNRFDKPLSVTLSVGDTEDALRELLLRGKVAYLFDRYVENQEITSMLLCIPGSNMETISLPGLVENWIALTHGNTPAARQGLDTVLFFVLTKFDELLVDSGAEGGATTRFQRRMEASLLEKFTQVADKWVTEWTPGRPFDNCFWLRNPKYPAEAVINYDGGREISLRPEKADRLAELKRGYLSADHVQRHFADPDAAWEAAMGLNDGGVRYLTDALSRVAKPDSKLRQIKAQLDRLSQEALSEVAEYYVSGDIETRIEEKRAAAQRVIDGLAQAAHEQLFGSLLRELMVDQDEIEARVARVPSAVRIRAGGGETAGTPVGGQDAPRALGRLRRPGAALSHPGTGSSAKATPAVAEGTPSVRSLTMAEFQAETALSLWIDTLKGFRDDPRGAEVYGFEPAAMGDLVAELVHAARRLKLTRRLGAELSGLTFGLSAADQAAPAAILCAERINTFVSDLGAPQMAAAERPMVEDVNGIARPAFTPRARADTADTLPSVMHDCAFDHASDWAFALEALFVANAKDGDAGTVNIEQNLALGAVLAALRDKDAAA